MVLKDSHPMDYIFILAEKECQDDCLNCPHLQRFVGYDGENVKECDHRKGAYHAAYKSRLAATYSGPILDLFEQYRHPILEPPQRGYPILEVAQRGYINNLIDAYERGMISREDVEPIIAMWEKGFNSTQIASILKLPEADIAAILRSHILQKEGVISKPEKFAKKPEPKTITRLNALKREMRRTKK